MRDRGRWFRKPDRGARYIGNGKIYSKASTSMLATVTAEWGPSRWAASTMLGGARRDQPARLEQIDDTPSKLGRRSGGRVKHEIWAFWRLVG
jgi:hypothetical protein